MTYDIIKTDNYLLILGDTFIWEGNEPYFVAEKLVYGRYDVFQIHNVNDWDTLNQYKILAHLPLNNSPVLEGVDLLPPLEYEVEEIAINEVGVDGKIYNPYDHETFIKGYNKAKEKYEMTLEKMIDLYIEETGYGMDMWSKEENNVMTTIAKITQSLSQLKYPIAFEVQMKCGRCYMPLIKSNENDCWSARECSGQSQNYPNQIDSIVKTNGQTILVGKYIY